MKVSIKELNVTMELGTKGVQLEVSDNAGKRLGELRIGKAKLEWCPGKTPAGRGQTKTWEQLVEFFEPKPAKPSKTRKTAK